MTTLKFRKVAIDTYKENVAYLHRDCPLYHSEGFQALNKIEISDGDNAQSVIVVLNIDDDKSIITTDQLDLSEQTFAHFVSREGSTVHIGHATPPYSLRSVHSKISGNRLSQDNFLHICKDIVNNRYSKIEIERYGDKQVNVHVPEGYYQGRNIVLVDVVASTGKTLLGAAKSLSKYKPASISVLVTHALFVDDAIPQLQKASISNIWSCDSIPHLTNSVQLEHSLAQAMSQISTTL